MENAKNLRHTKELMPPAKMHIHIQQIKSNLKDSNSQRERNQGISFTRNEGWKIF
jgi:hypothetical protein